MLVMYVWFTSTVPAPSTERAVPINTSSTSVITCSVTSSVVLPDHASATKTETVTLRNGRALQLTLPAQETLSVAAQGFKHLRFMAWSPDHRLFVGEMESANDSSNGHVYVFDHFDDKTKTFATSTAYLSHLRNPNSVAFYTDTSGQMWLYVALTDKLVRYPYQNGDLHPTTAPQVIATFPDYGRPWTNGGWHLTRTIVVHNDQLYVSVGSSCNSCEEKASEPTRASIVQMDPDGAHLHVIASGLRNAVGIQFLGDDLYATVNGPDHLGSDRPEDTFLHITSGTNYGWPYCYQLRGHVYPDTTQTWTHPLDCATVSLAAYGFDPHSAPLGFDVVDGQFLVALHGSAKKSIAAGYKIVEISPQTFTATDVLTGFLQHGVAVGRPVDILADGTHGFFVTDDFNGAIYYLDRL